jgi:hypothetical protein
MAHNEDNAGQRHCDLRMVMLTKSIESSERLIDLKMKMYDRVGRDKSDTYSLMAINLLIYKLEQLNSDLDSMVLEVRLTNPIVGNVLYNAKIAMGLVSPAVKGGNSIGLSLDNTRGMLRCDKEDDNDEEVGEDEDFVKAVV